MSSTPDIWYKTDLDGVNWEQLKADLRADDFDNGRTPAQYKKSFENSDIVIFAMDGDRIIGKARALSDGVCNAYVVDVWTNTPYRKQGIATTLMTMLFEQVRGQHVHLFTDDAVDFYKKLGFFEQEISMGFVAGRWLDPTS